MLKKELDEIVTTGPNEVIDNGPKEVADPTDNGTKEVTDNGSKETADNGPKETADNGPKEVVDNDNQTFLQTAIMEVRVLDSQCADQLCVGRGTIWKTNHSHSRHQTQRSRR